MLMLGLLLALLVLAGQHAAAEAPNVNAVPLLGLRVNGGIYNQTQGDLSLSKVSGRRAKIVVQNSFSLSLDANSAAGDQAVHICQYICGAELCPFRSLAAVFRMRVVLAFALNTMQVR